MLFSYYLYLSVLVYTPSKADREVNRPSSIETRFCGFTVNVIHPDRDEDSPLPVDVNIFINPDTVTFEGVGITSLEVIQPFGGDVRKGISKLDPLLVSKYGPARPQANGTGLQ